MRRDVVRVRVAVHRGTLRKQAKQVWERHAGEREAGRCVGGPAGKNEVRGTLVGRS
jgi:hypothetical protein